MARLFSMKLNVMAALSGLVMALLLPINAQATLIGANNVVVSFNSNVSNTDTVTVSATPEIQGGGLDNSKIGNNVLLAGEFIDFTDTAIVYQLMGGSTPTSNDKYFSAGYNPGDFFSFNNLYDQANANNVISSVGIALENVINVDLNTDVTFTAHSVQLNLDRLGVLFADDGSPDFGKITLNLQFQTVNPPPPQVAEPESLLLIGAGMLILALRHRRSMI